MRIAIAAGLALAGSCLVCAVPGDAAANCSLPGSDMERMICSDHSLAARDAAMTVLYRAALARSGASMREMQRRWLASARSCRARDCLSVRYDDRNSVLLETDGAHALVRRYRVRRRDTDGVLFLFRQGPWITYSARETVVGPRGVAAGDVNTASLSGTVRLVGPVARDVKPHGCEALLQSNTGGSWSIGTRNCFDGAGADLNERFDPVR